jgi:methyl-accepting chemotaxis protein
MKIQFKLILMGFVVIALLIGVIGYFAINTNQNVVDHFDEIADGTAPALLALGKIESSVHKINLEATSYALINAELGLTEEGAAAAAEELEEFLEAKEELGKWEDAFAQVAEDEEEQQFVEEIEEAETALFEEAQKLIDMKEDGISGIEILDQRAKLGEAEEAFEEIINRAIKGEHEELLEQDEAADAAAAAAAKILTIAVIAAVLLSLGMGLFVSRVIGRRLNTIKDAAVEIANGNMDIKIDTSGNDEIAELSKAIDQMKESLKVVMEEYENQLK